MSETMLKFSTWEFGFQNQEEFSKVVHSYLESLKLSIEQAETAVKFLPQEQREVLRRAIKTSQESAQVLGAEAENMSSLYTFIQTLYRQLLDWERENITAEASVAEVLRDQVQSERLATLFSFLDQGLGTEWSYHFIQICNGLWCNQDY